MTTALASASSSLVSPPTSGPKTRAVGVSGASALQPAGELARREEGDAEPAVAGGGGADHAAEGGERRGEAAGGALGAVEDRPGADGEGVADLADHRRRLDQDQPVEPHVGHRPRGGADVPLLARADEDDGGGKTEAAFIGSVLV